MRSQRKRVRGMPMNCYYCKEPLDPRTATADHIVPRSRGGWHNRDNLVPACGLCNNRKADMTGDEFVAWLATDAGDEWMRTHRDATKTFMEDWLAWYEKTQGKETA